MVVNHEYWERVRLAAKALNSDGCSGVPDFYRDGCLEHDVHYRTHQRIDGASLTRVVADRCLRGYIQAHSWFGVWSPMAWWRYQALRKFGRKAWDHSPEELLEARQKVQDVLGRAYG